MFTGNGLGFHPIVRHHVPLSDGVIRVATRRARFAHIWKTLNTEAIYVIDKLPVSVCDNIRIRRSKIYSKEDFRGYQASKKRYFYGLKSI